MYRSKRKTTTKDSIFTHHQNFSPFDMMDTRYLDHLHHQAKIRNSRDTLLMKLKDCKES